MAGVRGAQSSVHPACPSCKSLPSGHTNITRFRDMGVPVERVVLVLLVLLDDDDAESDGDSESGVV